MRDVFLSYAHEDRATARRLAERLEAAGLSVWWDPELRAGDDFPSRIEEVLGDVGSVVVLWSRHSVASRWVRAEATEGLERGKLIPVALDAARPPLVFRGVHTASWEEIESREEEWEELVGAIRDRARGGGEPSAEPPPGRKKTARRPLTLGQLLAILAALLVVSAGAIAALHSVHKATVVELDLVLSEASLTVVPESGPPFSGIAELLDGQLPVETLRWTGAEAFEANFAGSGRATAEPGASGAVTLRAGGALEAFQANLRLRRPTRLGLLPSGRDGLAITLDPTGAEPGPGDWECEVPPREGLEIELRDVELTVPGEAVPDPAPRLEPAAKAIVFRGGGRRAELALRPEGGAAEDSLLAPNLPVAALSLHRFGAEQREQSLVRGGEIRFPRGEKEPIALEPGHFVRLPEEARMKLAALRLADGDLELVAAGELASVEWGPTFDEMAEQLPSLFVWLSTHQLPVLVFSVLATVVAAALSLLKLSRRLK